EPAPDHERAAKQRLDLLRARIGCDVEVFRRDAEQQVAHRAADDARSELVRRERVADSHRGGADPRPREPVSACRRAQRAFVLESEYAPDEALDHAGAVWERSDMTRHRRRAASASSWGSGSTATGSVTRSSSGRSLCESL